MYVPGTDGGRRECGGQRGLEFTAAERRDLRAVVVDDGALDDAALVAQQVVVGDSSGVWARIESLRAEPGEALALIGPSGSGKTSLLRAFLGFAPFAGRVRVLGLEPSGARRTGRVLMLPQDAGGSLDPLVSIGRQLVELASIGRSRPDRREVLEALGAVGLPPGVFDAWPHTVSGGEARRVWIAVALLRRPDVLLVDEPEAGLDPRNRVRVADLLAGRVGEAAGCTVITTHDQAFARRVGARVVEVGGNSIDSDGAAVGGAASSTRPRPGIPGEARLAASDVGINLGGNTIVGSASLTVAAGEVRRVDRLVRLWQDDALSCACRIDPDTQRQGVAAGGARCSSVAVPRCCGIVDAAPVGLGVVPGRWSCRLRSPGDG